MESVLQTQLEDSALRVEIYGLLAHLFRKAPDQTVLDWLSALDVEANQNASSSNTMAASWPVVKLAAQTSTVLAVEEEYQDLFIGIGRGEIVPFGSWYLTGSLMEMPLAHLRRDLMQLGFAREENVKEPEDHIAALLEVMAMLVEGGDKHLQQVFFNRHIATWFERLFTDLKAANSAVFYSAVAELALQFLLVEKTRLVEVN
ncbi:molecular chaperone TorD family protein [Photobacterium sp. BZF1]|uniref:TorD/DmsD family molecular chaperone n=1 Tax=Photobacterium sp. BZF1 TaxID=1904457 RepID=UPI001653ECD5|nr:molecular chaperone TorD family protein [Photobacterium sp. BZF1]MBC7003700.1 molecular chaperone TorD family protein [Photobacterium sp. BZF1]